MSEHEIADRREEEALLEVASTFASRERNKLLEILSSPFKDTRAQKILYQRAIRSLAEKGLVQFSADSVFSAALGAPETKWYVAVTDEGRRIAEDLAERRLAPPADDAAEARAG